MRAGQRGAIIHEWIAKAGGSENVFEAMADLYPDADLFCLWNDSVGRFDADRLHQSWLARTPLRRSKAAALPLMPLAWRRLAYADYDWVLISSHLFAHHARFVGQPADLRRYVYVHTPARYIWNPELDGRGNGLPARLAAAALKPLDRRRAQQPAAYAANSDFVRDRMTAAWGVDSRVIYPPVEVETIQSVDDWRTRLTEVEQEQLASLPTGFVLGASRFIPYKRLELVIQAGEAAGRPVVLAGRGPELERLRAAAAEATVPVRFVHAPSGPLLWALYQQTALYVFPAVEDFGIMPVEAMAAGAPVLAQAVGGTAESVVPGSTGALITFASAAEMAEGVEIALATRPADRLLRARAFSRGRFDQSITDWVGAA
ncbi:MAG: glycosyltransferase [Friedmanniella sp.]|nr:glycosyltransferase [Friedmanniella sp.]